MLARARSTPAQAPAPAAPGEGEIARIALLGSGTVGQAVLERLYRWRSTEQGRPLRLVYAANTRVALQDGEGLCPLTARAGLVEAPAGTNRDDPNAVVRALGDEGIRILIDATADGAVARRHPELLRAGIHVATACKLATGTTLDLWDRIGSASRDCGSGFGDRATVGAGLPLLRSIRELRAGGDRIHAIAGIMSGSLAWLFDRFDGSRAFSLLVREAWQSGFTEPDPREDLSGEDVRRKILILARAAGFAIDSDEVEVQSLVPDELAGLPANRLGHAFERLDAPLAKLLKAARAQGKNLRFVARFADGGGDHGSA